MLMSMLLLLLLLGLMCARFSWRRAHTRNGFQTLGRKTKKTGHHNDLWKCIYVCNKVQDFGKNEPGTGKRNFNNKININNKMKLSGRLQCVSDSLCLRSGQHQRFLFTTCFCSVEHCSKSKAYLLTSGMQWPIRGVSVIQNPLTT